MGMFDRKSKEFTKHELERLEGDIRRWWTQGADSYPMPMMDLLDLIDLAKRSGLLND